MSGRKLDIFMVGLGGQGILTIGELIGNAALTKRIPVNFFPTKGMTQRGGFVKAQLRLGLQQVGGDIPLGRADMVIAMEMSESLKALSRLKKGGVFLVYGYRWHTAETACGQARYPELAEVETAASDAGCRMIYVDPQQLPEYKGRKVADNVFLLGVAEKHTPLGDWFTGDDLLNSIVARWPRGAEDNQAAFLAGQQLSV